MGAPRTVSYPTHSKRRQSGKRIAGSRGMNACSFPTPLSPRMGSKVSRWPLHPHPISSSPTSQCLDNLAAIRVRAASNSRAARLSRPYLAPEHAATNSRARAARGLPRRSSNDRATRAKRLELRHSHAVLEQSALKCHGCIGARNGMAKIPRKYGSAKSRSIVCRRMLKGSTRPHKGVGPVPFVNPIS